MSKVFVALLVVVVAACVFEQGTVFVKFFTLFNLLLSYDFLFSISSQ